MDHATHLLKLLAAGELRQAIKELLEATEANGQSELYNILISLSGRFNRNERSNMQGVITQGAYQMEIARIQQAVRHYITEKYAPAGKYPFRPSPDNTKPTAPTKKIFISYSHADKELAHRIKHDLAAVEGFSIVIDQNNLLAGENIQSFIERSVRECDAILSIVSSNSLLSVWVARETVNSLFGERVSDRDKTFIGVFADGAFFQRAFVDEALDEVEDNIRDIRALMHKRLQRGRPVLDLQEELRRYEELQHHLPDIVRRLKEHLSINVAGDKYEYGLQRLIKSLRS